MRYALFDRQRDELILAARLLLMLLFVIYGWSKLTNFPGTVSYMAREGLPLPAASAVIAIVMELLVGLALMAGYYTRPLALIPALYTLGTAFLGHHFWTTEGGERMAGAINFYKNISITGGLLLLCATGPGKYSLDRR